MAVFKLTDNHRTLILERKRAGISLREIARWLEATEGVKVTATTIKDVVDKDAERRRAKLSITPNVATKPAESTGESDELGSEVDGNAGDYALLSKVLRDLEQDIAKNRDEGNVQGLIGLERLRADLLARRAKLRPPAPPSELAPELVDAGRKAADKLMRLVEIEIAKVAT